MSEPKCNKALPLIAISLILCALGAWVLLSNDSQEYVCAPYSKVNSNVDYKIQYPNGMAFWTTKTAEEAQEYFDNGCYEKLLHEGSVE
jgi:hypothetical protein